MENTGAIYGVSSLKYNGSALGLISEDGMQPGGDSATKNRIWAAQKRNAPFAVIKGTPGTKMWTFTLIEHKDVQGVFDIGCTTGHTIRIYNGLLTCNFANGINFSNVLGISCELEMQEAGENKPAYKIFAPGEVPPASELPNQGA